MEPTETHEAERPEFLSDLPLVGFDGNAFAVIGRVSQGLRRAGAPDEYVRAVVADMMSGDYDHLLAVAVRYSSNP